LLEGCTIVTSSTDRQATAPWRAARGTGISRRLLVACTPFGPRLPARAAANAIARGLIDGGLPQPDICPLPITGAGGHDSGTCMSAGAPDIGTGSSAGGHDGVEEVRAVLEELDFDARLRRARAVVVGTALLEERTLAGSVAFEIATRARQGGVPAYAVTGDDALVAFDARILDLQVILEARGSRGLVRAGRELARLV
jgi:glycerate 2-kinase